MNALVRWGKFNLVGGIGMGVQLALLALLNRAMPGRYLLVSAVAIEVTLLHNFAWHRHYTWRDRRGAISRLEALMRFHLSNGVVSMLGNLVLMQSLIHRAHLPLLIANAIAILCCSVVNFFIGNLWAFARPRLPIKSRQPLKATALAGIAGTAALLLLFVTATPSGAQSQSNQPVLDIPNAPASPQEADPAKAAMQTPDHTRSNEFSLYNLGALCGLGASTSTTSNRPTAGCGVGMTLIPTPLFIEFGVMAPQANRSFLTGYLSVDSSIPLGRLNSKYLPMAIVGYSRLFETGHALDYGLALALPRLTKHRDSSKSLRVELRDYWTFANPTQHNVMIRVGWMIEESD